MKKRLLLTLLGLMAFAWVHAQVHGTVIDATDKLPVPFASVSYKDLRVSVVCDVDGHFRIAFHPGHKLSVSSIGYSTRTIQIRSDKDSLIIALRPELGSVTEVTVKARRKRYRRKDTLVPATGGEVAHDTALTSSPISVDETLSADALPQRPATQGAHCIIEGKRSTGVEQIVADGRHHQLRMLKEVFQGVNINDDHHVRLLQYPPSQVPSGKTAISFLSLLTLRTPYKER